ncbi:MAG: hypothetical protein Q4F97_01310 [Bacteroidales bacterium]|nr:hypothetical protein [Bacteroidales bacterium]
MKQNIKLFLLVLFFMWNLPFVYSQEQIPLKNSISLGPLIGVSSVYNNDLSYFSDNNIRFNYGVNGEYVHFFHPGVGVGCDYTYLKSRESSNNMSINIVGPAITLRYLFSPYSAVSLSMGISYMNYNENVFYLNKYSNFDKNFVTANMTMSYSFHLGKNASGMFKFQTITADWFVNPEFHWQNDDGEFLFDNDMSFFTLGFSIIIGK